MKENEELSENQTDMAQENDKLIEQENQTTEEAGNQSTTENQTETEEGQEGAAEANETVTFEDLGLDEYTLKAVAKKGFVTPSPIQVLAIPRLLNGDTNLIARARTGTGKTAAFGLPIIQNIHEKSDHVEALILEPTRELAMQTCTEMQSFATGDFPRTTVLYGGASYSTQIKDLKRGCEIVVGTPGRIQDHIEKKTLDLSKIKYFILDEGDEMLDMGFIDDIEEIFRHANPDCRILLFSATMPAPILKIAGDFMGEYDIIEEEKVIDEALLIDQKYWTVKESEKVEALVRLIDISPDFYGLVFTMTKSDADRVTRELDMRGYEAAALHGDIMQNQREKVLERFRMKKTRILVATDVAARGIDISGVTHVVNYSLPFDTATYVHRIGRTGRAGTTGTAVTFVRPEERRKLGFLCKNILKATKSELKEDKVPTVGEVLSVKERRLIEELKGKLFVKVEEEATGTDSAETAGEPTVSGETSATGTAATAGVGNKADGTAAIAISETSANDGATVSQQTADTAPLADSQVSQTAASILADSSDTQPAASSQTDSPAAPEATPAPEPAASSQADSPDAPEATPAPEPTASPLADSPVSQPDPDTQANLPPVNPELLNKTFTALAADLTQGRDANEVLAGVLSILYGDKLSPKHYGRVSSQASGPKGDQTRIFVSLGKQNGYRAREIATFFSDLLHIPGRLVDDIDVAQQFSLVSLPTSSAKKAIEMSKSNHKLPHMHIDIKEEGGGRRRGGKGGFSGKGDSFGDKAGGKRDSSRTSDFSGKKRGERSRKSDKSSGYGKKEGRPNVHAQTERSSSRKSGSASLYKKSKKAERF